MARITKRGIHFKYDYPTFDGKTATHDKDGDVVIYHDLKITVEDNSIEKEINDRVKELMKNKTSSMHDISPVYPNLFSPIMHESWKTERNDEGEIETVPTTVDSHDVDKMFLQLVTGAVLVREDKPFDLDSWIRNSMEKAYRRSFPDENSMLEWFDVYCEYLLRSEKNSYNRSIDDAYDMRDALYEKCESYKGNRIMTLIQRALSNAL